MTIQRVDDEKIRLTISVHTAMQFFIRGMERELTGPSSTCPYCFRDVPHSHEIHDSDAASLEIILHTDIPTELRPAIRKRIKALWDSKPSFS